MRAPISKSARSHRPQYLLAAFVPALIVVLSISGFVWAQKDVTVLVDGRTLHLRTQASDVAALLEEAGLPLGAGDVVTPPSDAAIEDGATVVIRHAMPVVLDLGGERVSLDVIGETVADALVAAGVDPASHPAVAPASHTPLSAEMVITVPDVFVRVRQEESTVEAPVLKRRDRSLPEGSRRVIEKGRDGRVLKVYRVLVTNGTEGPAFLKAEETVEKPQPRIIAVGTAPKPPAKGTKMRVEATGYSAKQKGLNSTTATGAKAVRGVIAVDPRVIPMGTRVYVPGYGYAVAADTGGAIRGKKIDLCFNSVAECFKWGRRTVTITIVD